MLSKIDLSFDWNVSLCLIPTVHKSKMAQFSEIANHAWKMGGKVDGFLSESTSINEQKVRNYSQSITSLISELTFLILPHYL